MDPEAMRSLILQGIDKVLDSPWILRWISNVNRRLLRAERDYWQTVAPAELQALINLYNKEPDQ